MAKDDYLLEKRVAENSNSAPMYFDVETLGGLVMFDKFQTILDASLP